MSDFIRSNRVLNAGNQPSIIIIQYPLQHTKSGILERYYYLSIGMILRLFYGLKPIAIFSSWRVQK